MYDRYYRYSAGLIILITHISNIAMLSLTGRFGPDHVSQHIASVLVLAPLTLVYLVPFIKMATLDGGDRGSWIPFLPMATMSIVIVVFCSALTWVVYEFSQDNGFATIDDFKMWLGVMETSFGGLVGLIFERLFGVKIAPAQE